MQISVVVITLNEEKNIKKCIEACYDIADEIIVVDSFSSDKTKDICLSYAKVKFIEQKWLGYSQQKNLANSQASFDTILSIDADEIISEELKNSIVDIKQNKEDKNIVYSLNRLTNYCGAWITHCGWYPDKKVRIFNKEIKWIGENVHENLDLPKSIEVKHLKGELLHYSFYSVTDHIKQVDKFTSLTAKEAFEKGKKVGLLGLLMRPKWRFFRDYILKKGFLDGYAGYQVCKISAFATYLKYAKLRELHKK